MAAPAPDNKATPQKTNIAEDAKSYPSNSVEIQYSKSGTVPPVFVATSFSSPPWAPFEMNAKQSETAASSEKSSQKEYRFSRLFAGVPNGTHHYKFRLGAGDWWTTAEDQKTATDEHGNKNNVLSVGNITSEQPKESVPAPAEQKTSSFTVIAPSAPSQSAPSGGDVKSTSVPVESKTTLGDAMKSATTSAVTAVAQIPAAATAMTSIAPHKAENETAAPPEHGLPSKVEPDSGAHSRPPAALPGLASESMQPKDAPRSALASVMKLASETPLPASPAATAPEIGRKHGSPIHLEHHHASPSPPASRRLADTAAEVADTASMLDRSSTPTPAGNKAPGQAKLSAEEEQAKKHMIRTLTQFRSRVDVLLDDAHDKGLLVHNLDHITDDEPGHFPRDEATEISALRQRPTTTIAQRNQNDTKPVRRRTEEPQQAENKIFPWTSHQEILAGLAGGFVGTMLASLVMWILLGHR